MKKSKKKKILFIGQLPPPWHGVSAINSWILTSKQLSERYDFYPINLTTATTIADIGKLSFKKYIHFSKTVLITLYSMIRLNPAICYITLNPTGSAFFKDSIILLVLKIFRMPIIVHFHGKGITDWVNRNANWVKTYYQNVLKRTHLIVLGDKLIKDVEIVYKQRPFVVPNGIPLINQQQIEPSQHAHFKILFLSNLMESKGILDFVEALVILSKRLINFKAWIIGDSGDLSIEYIQQKIKSYNLEDCVEVLGPKYKEEKYEYLASADVLVFPTHNEAFGLVLLEAMQLGLPIITTNEGCIPEIIEDNVNGFIIDKHNPDSIANRLEYVIKNPQMMLEIGKKNRAKFRAQYTLDIFEGRILKIFEKITS